MTQNQRWAFEQQTHILLQIYNRFTTDFHSVTDSNSVVILWVEILVNNRITTELKSVNWFTGSNSVVNLLLLKTQKWILEWINNLIKMIIGWIPGFLWIHPLWDFCDFPENGHFESKFLIMAILLKNLRNHIYGEFIKIRKSKRCGNS